jgi:L,D-peptidoglycan transpeptidase YkuD (ErfK/YbiS/YcfS/YnhG family)
MGRLGVLATCTALLLAGQVPAAQAAHRPLPASFSTPSSTKQIVTVTSRGWNDTRATLRAWRLRGDGWHLVRGPVRVRLGWSGWVPGGKRRQSSGTTPAGRFTMEYAFGNRRDPGTELRYRHVDRDDVWPYEPRDPATYNILQPFQSRTSHWRPDYRERLADYGRQYAYAVVLGFNLPDGVHWSKRRHQRVAREPADTDRGGGIFLHVQGSGSTAGCVAGPITDIRRVVRWLDPDLRPLIVMGPRAWVKRRF